MSIIEKQKFDYELVSNTIKSEISTAVVNTFTSIKDNLGISCDDKDSEYVKNVKDKVDSLTLSLADALEDLYNKSDRCVYCGHILNPKKHLRYEVTGQCYCDMDCFYRTIENDLTMVEE